MFLDDTICDPVDMTDSYHAAHASHLMDCEFVTRILYTEAVLAIRPGRPWPSVAYPKSFLAYPNGAGHPHDPHVHHFCWTTQNLLGL